MNIDQQISACCNETTRLSNPDAGLGQTVYYICNNCGEPCDLAMTKQTNVITQASPDLIQIVGKHSKLWNYSKLETLEKLVAFESSMREQERKLLFEKACFVFQKTQRGGYMPNFHLFRSELEHYFELSQESKL